MEASAFIYDVLYKHGYKMMHLMGDTDGILSLTGAWKWIRDRKFKVSKPWTPWSQDGNFIGFIKEYTHFTLVTVHGEGHGALHKLTDEVPNLINRFISDQPLTE
jgi:hypothetical protein